MEVRFSPRGDLVAATMDRKRRELGLWTFPEGRLLRSLVLGDEGSTEFFKFSHDGERLITSTEIRVKGDVELVIRSWPVEGGEPDLLAHLELPPSSAYVFPDVDPTGSRFSWPDGRNVRIAPLVGTTLELVSAMSVEHDRAVAGQIFDQQGRQLATSEKAGTIRIWSLESDPPKLTHTLSGAKGTGAAALLFDSSGSMLAGGGGFLWDLAAPPDAEPLRLQRPGGFGFGLAFDRNSDWLATSSDRSVSLWPVARAYPRLLRGHEEPVSWLAFSPDGKNLVSTSQDGTVRVWPLDGSSGERSRILYQVEGTFASPSRLAMAPDGSFVVAGATTGRVVVIPLDGGPVRELVGFTDLIFSLAVGPQARLVAAGAGAFNPEEAIVRVWDLATDEMRILDAGDGVRIWGLIFTGDGDLWIASRPKLRRWQLDGDPPGVVEEIDLSVPNGTQVFFDDLSPDGQFALLGEFGEAGRLWIQDLDTHESRELSSHAGRAGWASLDPTGEQVISTDGLGTVRIGPVTGEEPHLLPGHEAGGIAVSPDGRWIASGGKDNTIRLWPMPDLSEPPLHTLPCDELLAKLRSLTNLRVVEDPESPSGWKVEPGPFPGWEEVPTW
jgi:WD40 repeat protein